MLDINVKTIDGLNRSYSVPDNYTVRQFKEKISNSLNIPVDRQRLIFQGRELKDTSSLLEFDVNGKTLHLVQRAPPSNLQTNQTQSQPQPQTNTNNNSSSSNNGHQHTPINNNNNNEVQQIIQQLLGGLGDLGQNAVINTTTNPESNGMEVHIDLSNVSQIVNENEIRSRVRNIRRFLSLANSRLNRLNEIQSGAPLDDASNSSIIVGSIHGTATLSDASGSIGTIGFDINHLPNFNIAGNNPIGQIPIGIPTQVSITRLTSQDPSSSSSSAQVNSSVDPVLGDSGQSLLSHLPHLASAAASAQRMNPSSFMNFPTFIPSQTAQSQSSSSSSNPSTLNQQSSTVIGQETISSNDSSSTSSSATTLNQQDSNINTTSGNNEENNRQTSDDTTTNNANSSTEEPTTANRTSSSSASTNANANQQRQNINVEVLADLIGSVMDSYSRFLPYLQQYHEMLVNDADEPPESPSSNGTTAGASARAANLNVINTNNSNIVVLGGGDNRRQRFCNNINDMMHLLGHLFHNLSDLHVNIRDRPPRQMHTMNSMQHSASAIISSAIPVEANIQIPFVGPLGGTTTTTTTNSTTTTTRNGTNVGRQRTSNSLSSSLPSFSLPNLVNPTPPPSNTNNNNNNIGSNAFQTNSQRFSPSAPATGPRIPIGANFSPPFQYPPPLQYSTLNSYDQFLPCNSVHFYNTPHLPQSLSSSQIRMPPTTTSSSFTQRRRHPAGDQHSSSATINPSNTSAAASGTAAAAASNPNNTSSTTSTTNTSNTQQQQQQANNLFGNNNDIGRLIGNLLSSTIRNQNISGGLDGSGNQHIRVNIGGMPGQISIATLSTSGDTSPSSLSTPNSTPTGPTRQNSNAHLNTNTNNNTSNTNDSRFSNQFLYESPVNLLIGQLIQGIGADINNDNNQQQRAAPSQTSNSNAGSGQMVQALIREAINLMDSSNSNDQRLNQPLREFMRLFGSLDEEEEDEQTPLTTTTTGGTGSTLSIFNVLFSSMTLGNMINLARGQSRHQVFERSREPLRNHIRTYFGANNNTPSEENISQLVDRMYNEIFIDANGLNIQLNQFELSDTKIDFESSFEKLIKHHLKLLLNHVFDTRFDNEQQQLDNESTWSSTLFKKFQDLIDQMVTLCRACIKNADSQFTQVVTLKLRQAVVSQNFLNNSMFYGIFENFIRSQIQQTLSGISLTRSSIEQFILYKPTPSSLKSEDSNRNPVVDNSNRNIVEQPVVHQSELSSSSVVMEVDQQQQQESASSQSVDKTTSKLSQDDRQPKQESSTLTSTTTNNIRSSSSESWRSIVPSEWVPTIEKDIETQKKFSQQSRNNNNNNSLRSFSDAYCSGMPPKRRKIFSPKSDLLNVNLFKNVLNRTLEQVQLRPNVNQEQLFEDSLNNQQLMESFSSEFDSAVTQRLRQDPDFNQIISDSSSSSNDQSSSTNNLENSNNKDRFSFSRKRFK